MNGQIKQRGAALLVTFMLLVIALMLGLSNYQSSRLEEAMAGNYRASSTAYMAAEFAAAEAWNNQFLGVIKAEDDDEGFVTVTPELTQDLDEYSNLGAYYYYKEIADGKYDVIAIGEVAQEPSIYRYIQFQSRLAVGPGAALLATSDGEECPADTSIVTAKSGAYEVEGEEEVFGNLQAALQVGCEGAMNDVVESVAKNNETIEDISDKVQDDPPLRVCDEDSGSKLCNYIGGIQGGIDIDIFKNPDLMARFLDKLRRSGNVNVVHSLGDANGLQAADGITFVTATEIGDLDGDPNTDDPYTYWVDEDGNEIVVPEITDTNDDGVVSVSERQAQQQAAVDDLDAAREIGGEAYPSNRDSNLVGCIVVDDLCVKQGGVQTRPDFSNSGGFSGSGVLIVDGNAYFNGVPGFDGLIIVLGDYNVVGGGGDNGEFNGSVVSAPISGGGYNEGDFGSSDDPDSSSYVAGLDNYTYAPQSIYPDLGDNVMGNSLSCWRDVVNGCKFDKKIMQFSGGGNALYNYDLESLERAVSMLDDAVDTITTASGEEKSPTELFAYGKDGDPLGYYAVNYRQSFDRPQVLSDYLEENPGMLPND
ncbi:pilus assembly PilX family protein [Halomonas getboli]|uniref:pilus assembly PilX family protein n=1 Tax=Halomonas getboli TaxID=2935862 RepID=UPI001FFFFE76|nr:pilus assembly PilX N-terminal domain-containing protein [Halomonas getboli]MCK2185421.1 pilus assembly PilX N-terminal domain-containing protein [Halomonas getboli]